MTVPEAATFAGPRAPHFKLKDRGPGRPGPAGSLRLSELTEGRGGGGSGPATVGLGGFERSDPH